MKVIAFILTLLLALIIMLTPFSLILLYLLSTELAFIAMIVIFVIYCLIGIYLGETFYNWFKSNIK